MHKPESIQKNDSEIQTDPPFLPWKPDLVSINKKGWTCPLMDFAVPMDHSVKIKESEKIDK